MSVVRYASGCRVHFDLGGKQNPAVDYPQELPLICVDHLFIYQKKLLAYGISAFYIELT